ERPPHLACSAVHIRRLGCGPERPASGLEPDPAAGAQVVLLMRWAIAAGLVLAMLGFGIGVYHAVGYLKGDSKAVHRPNEISAPSVPGTMYVDQAGAIYRFQHGSFTQITSESGWTQVSPAPNNQLVAVRRQANFSDLYLLSTRGKTVSHLTRAANRLADANDRES